MKMNSEDDTLKSQKVDESMKALIMEYIKAQNEDRLSDAEVILHKINTMRKLSEQQQQRSFILIQKNYGKNTIV